MPVVQLCMHANVFLAPSASSSEALSDPNQPPNEQKDYYACSRNANDVAGKLSSSIVWVEERIWVETLSCIRYIC